MPQVNNIEHLRAWLRDCPVLSRDNHFRVDYLGNEPLEYTLISMPSAISFHENVLGESIPNDTQKQMYIFATRSSWGADEAQNIENAGFYQDVIEWIIAQNTARNLPRINEGIVTAIVPTLSAFVDSPNVDSARYQINIEVTYKMML